MKRLSWANKFLPKQSGLTLVELMIAMVLALFIIGAVISVFMQTKNSTRVNETVGRIQENGRFALRLLAEDLKHAGFFGKLHQISGVGDDASLESVPNDCGSATKWLYDLSEGIN